MRVVCVFHRERFAVGLCRDCRLAICPACTVPDGEDHLCPDCFSDVVEDGSLAGPLFRVAGWSGLGLGLAALVEGVWLFPTLGLATTALAGGLYRHLRVPEGAFAGGAIRTWFLGVIGLLLGAIRMHFYGVGVSGGFVW